MSQLVLVLDFGGQYKELIGRAVRSLSVYSEIRSGNIQASEVQKLNPIGIILTGGPNSVYLPESPKCDPEIFNLGIPILGICYGMQLMCHMLGGEVSPGGNGEYGVVDVSSSGNSQIIEKSSFPALMSHRDIVTKVPNEFEVTSHSDLCPIGSCENSDKKLYGVQFHPETEHTQDGYQIISKFLFHICKADGDYKLDDYIDTQIKEIRDKVGNERVILALSGGVDSSVCAAFLSRAIPKQLTCIFVDHGFMRLGEGDEIEKIFSEHDLDFIRVNAKERFLSKLQGVTDPETKRKIIGQEFIRVFEDESKKLGDIPFLAQGTIYPDIVESGGAYGDTIKSHHNVGGFPENFLFTGVIEPLAGLFKDEVRNLGEKLGLPSSLVNRQPFPGPGLAIRIMGEVTEEKLEVLRVADHIHREEIEKMPHKPQQYFAVLTDTKSVGVKGDSRTYDAVVALRAVNTSDFMTCDYSEIDHKTLRRISSRITSEIPSVSRVVYDITSKPPATVEWE